MIYSIEIPDDFIPVHYEPVAYRIPERNEAYSNSGELCIADSREAYAHLILRRCWQWPEWLKCDWIAKDKSGRWYGFNLNKPFITTNDNGWVNETLPLCLFMISDSVFPKCDWRDSLRENPNRSKLE